jgi:hypothetical protein
MLSKFVNIPLPHARHPGVPAAAAAAPESANGAPSVGVLNSPQAAVTFAGAPAAVTLVWKVLKAVFQSGDTGSFVNTTYCGALLAISIGLCVWFASSAPTPANDTPQAKMSRCLSAVFSIFAIIAATLGINPVPAPASGGTSDHKAAMTTHGIETAPAWIQAGNQSVSQSPAFSEATSTPPLAPPVVGGNPGA